MFIMLASAVGLFIKSSSSMSQYKFLDEEPFDAEYGVEGAVSSHYESFRPAATRGTALGVMLIILSLIPIFVSELLFSLPALSAISVPLLLALVSLGVYQLVSTGIQTGAHQKLLQIESYTPAKKRQSHIYGKVAGIYWLSATALYLAISFTTGNWGQTWVIWPVAGVSFGVISIIVSIFIDDKG